MIKLNGEEVNFGAFPNHESFADMQKDSFKSTNEIEFWFEGDGDLIKLKFIKDEIDHYRPDSTNYLVMPYFPYSRMDRREENRIFTLKSVANFINQMNFNTVTIYEPHSDVCVALLDRVMVLNVSCALASIAMDYALNPYSYPETISLNIGYEKALGMLKCNEREAMASNILLVYPDAGAEKRYTKQIKYSNFVCAQKQRDFNTGLIIKTSISDPDKLKGVKTAIIVDDLCSRGGTFIGVGKLLKQAGVERVYLCVTHCEENIFNGIVPNGKVIDQVFTTDSIISEHSIGLHGCKNIHLCNFIM